MKWHSDAAQAEQVLEYSDIGYSPSNFLMETVQWLFDVTHLFKLYEGSKLCIIKGVSAPTVSTYTNMQALLLFFFVPVSRVTNHTGAQVRCQKICTGTYIINFRGHQKDSIINL